MTKHILPCYWQKNTERNDIVKEKLVCSECGIILTEENANRLNDSVMCDDCFSDKTAVCDNCGERIWRDNAEGDSTYTLCSHCYEYSYTNCEDCGRLIHNDDAY